jgi:hypothetical protein
MIVAIHRSLVLSYIPPSHLVYLKYRDIPPRGNMLGHLDSVNDLAINTQFFMFFCLETQFLGSRSSRTCIVTTLARMGASEYRSSADDTSFSRLRSA